MVASAPARVIHAGITRRLRRTPGAGAGLSARDAADGVKPQERNHTVGSLQVPAVVRCDLQDPRPPRGGILSGQFLRADMYRCAFDLHVRMRISFQVEIPARVGGQAAVGGDDNHVLPVGEELQQHTAQAGRTACRGR